MRAREAGCRAVYLSPDVAARGGRRLDDPAFDRFWRRRRTSTCRSGSTWWCATGRGSGRWLPARCAARELFGFAFLAIDVMAAFTQMLASGMFERYPRLRVRGARGGVRTGSPRGSTGWTTSTG